MRRLAVAAAAVLAAGGLAASPAMARVDPGGSAPPQGLPAGNASRAPGPLSPADEELTWSGEAAEHARYQVVNGVVSSQQEPDAPFASIGGAEAARNADLAGIRGSELAGREAVDLWMTNPFHALGILRPRLDRVG